jgi:hypothetical protein
MSKKLDRLLEEIAEDFGQRSAETALDLSWFDSEKCFHSEIEYAMAVALRAMNCGYGWEFDGNQDVVFAWKETADSPIVQIQPKRKVGPYEIALAIRVRGPQNRILKLAIECDGHDFHEMSAEQAIKEKQFEKALTAGRYRLLRFTGAEISNDPAKCAAKIADEIDLFITPRKRRGS